MNRRIRNISWVSRGTCQRGYFWVWIWIY